MKGDILTKVSNKVPDRVLISPSCLWGLDKEGRPSGKRGSIVAVQSFLGITYYHVLIDSVGPPAFWYASDCLTLRQGQFLPLQVGSQMLVRVIRDQYEANFMLDQYGIDSYIDEGFTVIAQEDPRQPR